MKFRNHPNLAKRPAKPAQNKAELASGEHGQENQGCYFLNDYCYFLDDR